MNTTKQIGTTDGDTVSAVHSTSIGGDAVPTRVLIAPWGQVESTNGSFVLDEAAAKQAVETFEAHGTDLPIDYEHQTLGGAFASPTGRAPAAGWIKELIAEPGVGLIARIEWTERAKEMLAAKEYRYLSPVVLIRKTDRKLTAIHSAALTNKPAIVDMEPLVNRCASSDTAPLETADGIEPLTALRQELALSDDACIETVLCAAGRRLAQLKREATARHVANRVAEAMRSGKLVEAQRAWAEAMVEREESLFDEWLRSAPVVIQPGATRPPARDQGAATGRASMVQRARAEFRANPLLGRLTSEEAYVAHALRATHAA